MYMLCTLWLRLRALLLETCKCEHSCLHVSAKSFWNRKLSFYSLDNLLFFAGVLRNPAFFRASIIHEVSWKTLQCAFVHSGHRFAWWYTECLMFGIAVFLYSTERNYGMLQWMLHVWSFTYEYTTMTWVAVQSCPCVCCRTASVHMALS